MEVRREKSILRGGKRGTVPSGWQTKASIIPAAPPAMRFVAAEAGFLPLVPETFFADILAVVQLPKEIYDWNYF